MACFMIIFFIIVSEMMIILHFLLDGNRCVFKSSNYVQYIIFSECVNESDHFENKDRCLLFSFQKISSTAKLIKKAMKLNYLWVFNQKFEGDGSNQQLHFTFNRLGLKVTILLNVFNDISIATIDG